MILTGSAYVVWNLKKKQSLKIDPGTYKKKLGMLNVIKQLYHFILCNMMFGALKSNIDRGLPLTAVNIAFQCSITHHIALNEVQ